MLKIYLKVKSAAPVALLNRRLSEVPPKQRDELARNEGRVRHLSACATPDIRVGLVRVCRAGDICCYQRVEIRKLGAIHGNGSGSDLLCMVCVGMVAPMDRPRLNSIPCSRQQWYGR